MNRARALVMPLVVATRLEGVELARHLIVLGCALSLIFAGRVLPF